MCAFLPDDEERVVALTERSQGKGYTLDYLEKREVYLSLISNVSFLVREPRDQDLAFLTKPMSAAEKAEVRAMDLDQKKFLLWKRSSLPRSKNRQTPVSRRQHFTLQKAKISSRLIL